MSSDAGGAAGEEIHSRSDLLEYFRVAANERRGAHPRIGVEVELLPLDPRTGAARAYSGEDGVEAALALLLDRGYVDSSGQTAERRTRLERGNLAINLEPGAQVEVSGAPFETLAGIERELGAALADIGAAARARGFRLCGHGVQPRTGAREIELVPKRRYAIMTRHFEAHGAPLFRDMMRRTASIQATFDVLDDRDAGKKLRAALCATPVAAAIFANSPLAEGRPSGFSSERTFIWTRTDPARCGTVPGAFDGEWSFERYVDFALGVPAILLRAKDGGVEEGCGRPFRELLARGAPSGRALTRADWDLHLTTIFTDARLKAGIVECRPCDSLRPADVMAVPAFWTGLLYHEPSLDGALALLGPLRETLEEGRLAIAREGLRAELVTPDGRRLRLVELARELARLAAEGLEARGHGERAYLASVEATVATGRTAADRVLELHARGGLPAVVEDAAL